MRLSGGGAIHDLAVATGQHRNLENRTRGCWRTFGQRWYGSCKDCGRRRPSGRFARFGSKARRTRSLRPGWQFGISVVNRQRSRSPERDHLSGFQAEFVGLFVGFLSLPDKYSPNGISGLRAICVCLLAKKGVRRSRPLRGIGSDTFPGQFGRLNSARSHGAKTRIGARM